MNGSSRPRRRPASAASTGRPASAGVGGARGSVGGARGGDATFIADCDLWDDRQPQRRPTSAPVYKRSQAHDDVILSDTV